MKSAIADDGKHEKRSSIMFQPATILFAKKRFIVIEVDFVKLDKAAFHLVYSTTV